MYHLHRHRFGTGRRVHALAPEIPTERELAVCCCTNGDESKRWEKICHSQNQCVWEQRATRPPSGQRVKLHPLSPNEKQTNISETAGKCLKK